LVQELPVAASAANLQQTLSYRLQEPPQRHTARDATRDQDQTIEIPGFHLWKTGESRTASGRSATISGISGVPAAQLWGARAFYVLQTFLSMTAGPVQIKGS